MALQNILQTQSGFFIGPLYIYYYGLVYAIAAIAFYLVLLRQRKKIGLSENSIDTLLISVLAGLIIGGRVFHFLINDPSIFVTNPLELFRIRDGGMAFFGALIGILAGIGIWYRIQQKNALRLKNGGVSTLQIFAVLDIGCLVGSVALIFGRLANFLNQELVGRLADPTTAPWCVNFATAPGCRHPYQLYAAAAQLVLAAVLFVLLWRSERINIRAGTIFFSFLTGYGILRFITDFWRADPIFALGLTAWQFFALGLAIVGGYFLIRHLRSPSLSEQEQLHYTPAKSTNVKSRKHR